ncbi:hypothetical protein IFM89_029525 [Coptis chinensis]|uniref:Large ribosomal subunit protein uL18 C-terminal eukaryotes domain-containing protein n=1 Tax=Coptis chinensis TaxID=261450 RepID=A0A835H036_9MAGN|nr:hypothetical protein IFM89_029525 [Coptis chinensis]
MEKADNRWDLGNIKLVSHESLGVLMATSRRFDWTKNWELQDVGDKEWLWDNIKDKWELDETRKEPTLALISGDEFINKKSKWKRNFYTRYATYEERISHRPKQLSQQEWVQLMEFWDTPEHQLAEMQRVVQEKEEERRLEIEEIKRQAQEKDEQRRHKIDEMKRQLDARDADMETRLMQKVANFAQMVSRSRRKSISKNPTMVFIKPTKSRAYFKRYQVKFRRRRAGKTYYRARIRLINQDKNKYGTPKYHFVVRFTNKDIITHIVSASIVGDMILTSAYAHELPRYGLDVGLTNYSADFLRPPSLGSWVSKKLSRWMRSLIRTTTGALKGALDGGLDIPHSDKRFFGFKKENKRVGSRGSRESMSMVSMLFAYMMTLIEDERGEVRTHFSRKYIKKGIEADGIEELYRKVHAGIRVDPTAKKSEKEAPKAHKRFNLKKLTYDERRNKLIARLNAMNSAAGADDDENDD